MRTIKRRHIQLCIIYTSTHVRVRSFRSNPFSVARSKRTQDIPPPLDVVGFCLYRRGHRHTDGWRGEWTNADGRSWKRDKRREKGNRTQGSWLSARERASERAREAKPGHRGTRQRRVRTRAKERPDRAWQPDPESERARIRFGRTDDSSAREREEETRARAPALSLSLSHSHSLRWMHFVCLLSSVCRKFVAVLLWRVRRRRCGVGGGSGTCLCQRLLLASLSALIP